MGEGQGSSRDPAAELRALYASLQPPPLPDDLAEADPETARVVRWMQGSWRALEPSRVPGPPSVTRPRRAPRVARTALLAAAALVLVLAGTALWRAALTRGGAQEREPEVARGLAPRPTPAPAAEVEVLDVRPDQVELRSGPVRLVLLGPPPAEPPEDPLGDPPGS